MYYNQYPQYYQPMAYANYPSYQSYANQAYQDYYGYQQNYYGYQNLYAKQQPSIPMNYYPAPKMEYSREIRPIDNSDSVYEKMYSFNVSSSKNLANFRRSKSDAKVQAQESVDKIQRSKRDEATKSKSHKSKKSKTKDEKSTSKKSAELKLKQSLSQNKIQNESTIFVRSGVKAEKKPRTEDKRAPVKKGIVAKTGLTATEDVDKLLENMGYLLPPPQVDAAAHGHAAIGAKEKQDLMFSYGLTELEFDKAEEIFNSHCVNGKFEIKNLTKIFSLADRIQISELTNDDGDFLKFEEYLNIYQILKDLDL